MNFLIFFNNSLEDAQKVHTFCELLSIFFDDLCLNFVYLPKNQVFSTIKVHKKFACGAHHPK